MLFKINSRCYFTYNQSKDEWSYHFLKIPANKELVEECTGNRGPAHSMPEANKTHPPVRRSQPLRNCLQNTRVRNHSPSRSLPITAINQRRQEELTPARKNGTGAAQPVRWLHRAERGSAHPGSGSISVLTINYNLFDTRSALTALLAELRCNQFQAKTRAQRTKTSPVIIAAVITS